MSCSNPYKLYPQDIKTSSRSRLNKDDYRDIAIRLSLGHDDYFSVPCGMCLNCRVDRQNSLIDRAEWEYINYGCGAFVTFTFDDAHLNPYQFIDSKDGKLKATLSRKCGKDFLNRLNKQVKKFCNENGTTPLCRPDYKYILTGEYGDKFKRPHFHALFFGLDFAFCKRLFWRAWKGFGQIQVDPIRAGGIKYATKYISSQTFGHYRFYQYNYHHLEAPYSVHSTKFGEGLYKSQLSYIKNHNGNYRWHNTDRPLPKYYKDKYLVLSSRSEEYLQKKYKQKCNNIYNLYNHKIENYQDFKMQNIRIAKAKEQNLVQTLRSHSHIVSDPDILSRNAFDFLYTDNAKKFSRKNEVCTIIDSQGNVIPSLRSGKPINHLTVRDCMKLGTDYKTIIHQFGQKVADKLFGLDEIPF